MHNLLAAAPVIISAKVAVFQNDVFDAELQLNLVMITPTVHLPDGPIDDLLNSFSFLFKMPLKSMAGAKRRRSSVLKCRTQNAAARQQHQQRLYLD